MLKPRFGSWGRDVTRCDDAAQIERATEAARARDWFNATGAVAQRLIPPAGFDLRVLVAAGQVAGAVMRNAAPGEWRTNVALGAHRIPTTPPQDACELALAAAEAVGGDLVGVDLLPLPWDGWIVLEVNGAVEFNTAYSFETEIFSTVREVLLERYALEPIPLDYSVA